VTWAPHADDAGALPPFPVNGHGHFLPRVPLVERDAWITGSTYGRGDADESLRRQDDLANLERVQEVLPRAAGAMRNAIEQRATRSWSGVRPGAACGAHRPIGARSRVNWSRVSGSARRWVRAASPSPPSAPS
jgi:hypothetical protein